ncbi:MAG: carbohydrate ABC transporter permease [Candidatus Nanopelagicaceae bacterium]|nr:carbohydrate ABC transporter permease [Candidatus Nanopelagicaceae bacterium]
MIVGSRRKRRATLTTRYAILIAGSAVMIVPFLYLFATSFKPQLYLFEMPPQFIPEHPTTSNYTEAWTSNNFGHYFANSVFVSVVATALSALLSSMMAYAFARFSFKGQNVMFWILLIGLMVPGMMLLIPQYLLANQLHLLDSLLGLIVFYVATTLAFNTFLLRGFFEEIPWALEEAMIMDGAGPFRRYWKLILPLSRPALATVAIFTFLACWDEYVWALIIINDPDNRTLPIAISLFQGQHLTNWGLVFAASTIAIIPVILVFAIFQRQFIRGLSGEALKG